MEIRCLSSFGLATSLVILSQKQKPYVFVILLH